MLIQIRFAKTCTMHVIHHREGKEQDLCLDCPLSGSHFGLRVLVQSQSKFKTSGVFEKRYSKRRTNVSISRVQVDVVPLHGARNQPSLVRYLENEPTVMAISDAYLDVSRMASVRPAGEDPFPVPEAA